MTVSGSAGSECPGNCQSTQDQAIDYMTAEILWSTIYMNAWTNSELMSDLSKHANNVNATLEKWAPKLMKDMTPERVRALIPAGVTLKVVFDSSTTVHLVVPAFQNIPPSTIDMVPHAL